MVDRVLPTVRLLFPCDDAVFDASSNKWVLTNPWAVVMPPPGTTFPFDHDRLWLYAQLTDGVGEVDLVAELRRVLADGNQRSIKRWKNTESLKFPGGQQLQVFDLAFALTAVPFDEPGIYEFGLMANYVPLKGQTAEFRVLEARNQL
jgi:hypothetical protein